MKAVYTSDLHGEILLYQELSVLVHSSSADLLLLGGDLFPSLPPARRYEDMVTNQKAFMDRFLVPFLERMMKTAPVREVLVIPGNWDLAYFHLFLRPMKGLIDLSRRSHCLENGYETIGYPFVPPTPFRPKDFEKMDDRNSPWPPQKNPSYIRSAEQTGQLIPIDPHPYLKERGTIEEDLAHLPEPKDPEKTIYVMHSPPFETRLDRIEGGRFAGSRSIRKFIEKTHPLLTLHGHIHESPVLSMSCYDRIGQTLCVNPGQSIGKSPLTLHAVTFEVENPEKTLRHTLLPGEL